VKWQIAIGALNRSTPAGKGLRTAQIVVSILLFLSRFLSIHDGNQRVSPLRGGVAYAMVWLTAGQPCGKAVHKKEQM
jgi:hypothetical protein